MSKLTYIFSFICLIILSHVSEAQNNFFEDFNGGNALTNWTLIDADGGTPAAQVSYVNDAWVIREDFDTTSVGDSVAISTSFYVPPDTSDDYMISPMIVTGATPILEFDAKAQDPLYPDGYEVLISTTNPTVAGLGANPPLLIVPAESAIWNKRIVNLSNYANDSIYIGWRNNSVDDYLLLIDNIKVFDAPTNDAQIATLDFGRSVSIAPKRISGTIANRGVDTLTSVIVNYTVNGGAVNRDTLNLSLATGDSAVFSHPVIWNPTGIRTFSRLRIWTSMPNGIADEKPSNDTLTSDIFVNLGNTVSRTSLFELFTVSQCSFCPEGNWMANRIENNYSNVATVALHSVNSIWGYDAMTSPKSDTLVNRYGYQDAPIGMVNRTQFESEPNVAFSRGSSYPNWASSSWAKRALAHANLGSAVDVNLSGTYDAATRNISVTISTSFVDYLPPNKHYWISLMIVEDNVTGSGPLYDQRNGYQWTSGHFYAGQGDPILNYSHRRVMRDILPSVDGDSLVIPSNYNLNSAYTRTFTYNLDSAWNENEISLIGIVFNEEINNDNSGILNIYRSDLALLTSNESVESKFERSLKIYPNPSELPFTNLEFNLSANNRIEARIMDVTGKVVGYQDFGVMTAGNQRVQLNTQDLENGFYFVNLRVGDQQVSRKISILK